MRPASLRLRLLLAAAAAIILVLALSAAGLAVLFDRHAERVAVSQLQARAMALVALTEGAELAGAARPRAAPPADPLYDRPFSGHYWQMRLGDETVRSRSLWDHELAWPEAAPAASGWRRLVLPGPRDQSLLVVERQLRVGRGEGAVPLRIAVAADRAEITRARRGFFGDLLPYLALLGGLLMAASFAQITLGLRPLKKIGARVDRLSRGLAPRIGTGLPAEVMPLASGLDRLLDDRDREIDRARHRAGDLAHGFKTPLQALLGDATELRARGLPDIAGDIEGVALAMRRLVDRELARARIRAEGRVARCDPARVLTRLMRVMQRMPRAGALDWQVVAPGRLAARIEAEDLTEVLGALIENALRHATSRVEIGMAEAGREIVMTIRDDGPGVPEAELAGLAGGGVRLDQSDGGQGIGLAIAAEIIEAAGGRLDLANARPGLRAEIRLPSAAGEAA